MNKKFSAGEQTSFIPTYIYNSLLESHPKEVTAFKTLVKRGGLTADNISLVLPKFIGHLSDTVENLIKQGYDPCELLRNLVSQTKGIPEDQMLNQLLQRILEKNIIQS
jgi:hypothetical protein